MKDCRLGEQISGSKELASIQNTLNNSYGLREQLPPKRIVTETKKNSDLAIQSLGEDSLLNYPIFQSRRPYDERHASGNSATKGRDRVAVVVSDTDRDMSSSE